MLWIGDSNADGERMTYREAYRFLFMRGLGHLIFPDELVIAYATYLLAAE